MRTLRFLLCLGPLAAAAIAATAAVGSELTAELIADLKLVEEVRIAPDGKWISYLVKGTGKEGKQERQLWLASAEGEINERRLLEDYSAISEPRWSPDGRQLALFATNSARTRQLLLLDPHGGETRVVTGIAASDLAWSPDGRALSFVWREPSPTKKQRSGEPRLLGEPAGGPGGSN